MTSGAPIKREERVAADLSSLPEKESPIIVKKESLQHEIFKEGGIFDKYKQEKTEEMKQFVEERNLESELQDDTTKADKPVSTNGEDMSDVTNQDIASYSNIDVMNNSTVTGIDEPDFDVSTLKDFENPTTDRKSTRLNSSHQIIS